MTDHKDIRDITPEFSRIVASDAVTEEEAVHRIEAGPEERAALAERFDLLDLEDLTATVRLRRVRGGTHVRLEADFAADVVQACVVSLEPVDRHIEERFAILYGPESAVPDVHEVVLTVDAEEPPEPLGDGDIDMGEAVAQYLALSLDPYPRAPGARPPVEHLAGVDVLSEEEVAEPARGESGESGPFAALASLKKKWRN